MSIFKTSQNPDNEKTNGGTKNGPSINLFFKKLFDKEKKSINPESEKVTLINPKSEKVAVDKVETTETFATENQISTMPKSNFLLGLVRLPSILINRTMIKNAAKAAVITGGIVGVADTAINQSFSNIIKYIKDVANFIWSYPIPSIAAITAIFFGERILSWITRKSNESQFRLSPGNLALFSFFDKLGKKFREAAYELKTFFMVTAGTFFAADAIVASNNSNLITGLSKALNDVVSILIKVGEGVTSTAGVVALSILIFIRSSVKHFLTMLSGTAKSELAHILSSFFAKVYVPISTDLYNLASKLQSEGEKNPISALQNSKKLILEKIEADKKQIEEIINYRKRSNKGVSQELNSIAAKAAELLIEAQQTDSLGLSDSGRHIGIIAQEMDRLLAEAKNRK